MGGGTCTTFGCARSNEARSRRRLEEKVSRPGPRTLPDWRGHAPAQTAQPIPITPPQRRHVAGGGSHPGGIQTSSLPSYAVPWVLPLRLRSAWGGRGRTWHTWFLVCVRTRSPRQIQGPCTRRGRHGSRAMEGGPCGRASAWLDVGAGAAPLIPLPKTLYHNPLSTIHYPITKLHYLYPLPLAYYPYPLPFSSASVDAILNPQKQKASTSPPVIATFTAPPPASNTRFSPVFSDPKALRSSTSNNNPVSSDQRFSPVFQTPTLSGL